jgi:hypothetical protein
LIRVAEPLTPDPKTPLAAYESLRDRYTELQRVLAARSRRFSWARLLTFIAAVLLAVWAMQTGNRLAWILTLATIPTFITLVVFHDRVRRAERHAAGRRHLATLGIARINRTWDKIPLWPAPPGIVAHPYGYDLDLFGIGSLTQLMGEPGSPQGRTRLVHWLVELPPPEETRARQEAVRELGPQLDYRDELKLAAGGMSSVAPAEVAAFTDWCRETGNTFAPWQRALFVIIPIALWATALPKLMGLWSANAWILPAAASFAITFGPWGTRTRNIFTRVFTRDALFHQMPDLLGHIAEHDYTAPRLQQLRAALRKSGDSPRAELERLRRIAHLSDMRRSTVYPIVQLLTLWDQHVLWRLDAWRKRAGTGVPGWIEAAADMEALSGLATLAHDNPAWSYAEIREDADRIEAKALGHPLLAPADRVDNDVTVGPRGTFLLVTGSNMSGKSTLLRSIGTNIVLARVGAPVCAQALTLPVALPCVSMGVQDSIASGVSFFMAELKRVREIVTLAERAQQEGWTCVFLLDEMLHGTNSAERRIAARTVITRLVRAGAIGAVSTHDLQLGAEPELRDLAVRIHFTETVRSDNGRPVMTFDYKIRPGDATSTNALVLLEIMGLK